MIYEPEFIKEKIMTNDTWLSRAIVAIYNNQTDKEKINGNTREDNGIGFNRYDAPFLSSLAEFYLKNKFLSKKQIFIARKRMLKYVNQLTEIANRHKRS